VALPAIIVTGQPLGAASSYLVSIVHHGQTRRRLTWRAVRRARSRGLVGSEPTQCCRNACTACAWGSGCTATHHSILPRTMEAWLEAAFDILPPHKLLRPARRPPLASGLLVDMGHPPWRSHPQQPAAFTPQHAPKSVAVAPLHRQALGMLLRLKRPLPDCPPRRLRWAGPQSRPLGE
jgi:hypothetical protein